MKNINSRKRKVKSAQLGEVSDLPEVPNGKVDLDVSSLQTLMMEFDAFSENGLYHATRVLVRPEREAANDLASDWEDFLDVPTFQHSAFRLDAPLPRVQHFCFFGSGEHIVQFTGLAQQAALLLPVSIFPRISPNPQDWEARCCRDQWLLALYRLAYLKRELLPVTRNMERNGESAHDSLDRGFFDPLSRAACMDENERSAYKTWRKSFDLSGKVPPRYLYIALSTNVWKATAIAIDYVLRQSESRLGTLCDYTFWEDVEKLKFFFPEFDKQFVGDQLPDSTIRVMGVEYRADTRTLRRDGSRTVVSLSLLEGQLFQRVLKAEGSVVSLDGLRDAWGDERSRNDQNIHTITNRLNKKIAGVNLMIENQRKIGYRLIVASREQVVISSRIAR